MPRRPSPPPPLRIAVAIDEVGVTYQEPLAEIEEIRESLINYLARPVDIVDQALSSRDLGRLLARDPDVDIIVVDYGGLTSSWDPSQQARGTDMERSVSRWAEDHPGRLLLIWTNFTTFSSPEAAHLFTGLENCITFDTASGPDSMEGRLLARFGPGNPAWLAEHLGVTELIPPPDLRLL